MAHRTVRDPLAGRTASIPEIQRDAVEAQYRRCVRCGRARPAPELFICGGCEADPATRLEIARIEEFATSYTAQRAAIVEVEGWVGGWWRK